MHALPVFAVFFLVNRKNQQPSINVSGKNEKKTEEAQREEGLKIAVDILKREIAKYDDVAAKPRYNIMRLLSRGEKKDETSRIAMAGLMYASNILQRKIDFLNVEWPGEEESDEEESDEEDGNVSNPTIDNELVAVQKGDGSLLGNTRKRKRSENSRGTQWQKHREHRKRSPKPCV